MKAKQDINEQPRSGTKIRKKSKPKAQIYADPGEYSDDFSESEDSQNYYSASCSMFQGIQNISSNVRKELMTRSSWAIKVTPKSSSDMCKRNVLNVTTKGNGNTRRSKQVLSIQGIKAKEQMGGQNNAEVQVKNINSFPTSTCAANNDQNYAFVKDSEAKNDETDIKMSKINREGKHNQKIKKDKFTPPSAAEYPVPNGDDDYSDYASPSEISPYDWIDEPTVQASNTGHNSYNDENTDDSVSAMSSAASSPSYCMNESLQQTKSKSDVLPQHSPLQYMSLGSYSVST